MNPDSPIPSREELEAQLTDFILGELPADQAFALGQAIEKDADLARLFARLQKTVELVRETETAAPAKPLEAEVPLKMSGERRERLLARFKTVAPIEFAERKRDWRSRLRPLPVRAA